MNEESSLEMQDNLKKWMNWNPVNLKGCQGCKTLPQCMGGCPYLAFQQEGEGEPEKGHCDELRYNLRETVGTYYLGYKNKR